MNGKLLTCPFCGLPCQILVVNQGTKWAHYEPSCLEVRTHYDMGGEAMWRTHAEEAWNTRVNGIEYAEGFRDGYNKRDSEVMGALA